MIGIVLAALLGEAEAVPALPGWMAGCWEQRSGDDWTEECWTGPRGGMMIGSSRSGSGDRLDEWETMQIIREDTDDPAVERMAFWAAPGGLNRTMFAWISTREPGVTFVNLANEYPQRIRYWREGNDLLAEVSLGDGSKRRRWRYAPRARP
jgi:hypothetical protein